MNSSGFAIEMIKAEMWLSDAARAVLTAKTRPTLKKRLAALLDLSAQHAEKVAPLEQTTDSTQITRNILHLVTEDARPYWEVDPTEDENDSYAQTLNEYRSRLPLVELMLDEMASHNA